MKGASYTAVAKVGSRECMIRMRYKITVETRKGNFVLAWSDVSGATAPLRSVVPALHFRLTTFGRDTVLVPSNLARRRMRDGSVSNYSASIHLHTGIVSQ